MKKIEICYPSFTKKALTFTIDDGNMTYDSKLLSILAPAGIRGTFNLCSDLHVGKEQLTEEFYRDYDIANHSKHHPFVNYDGVEYIISDEEFDELTSDRNKIYRVPGKEGFFWHMRPNGWRQMVFEDDFLTYIKEGKSELENIFENRVVKDFVWPYGEQDNAAAHELIRKIHRSSRKSGCIYDKDGFGIPRDKYAWSYNADHTNLLEVMAKYEEYPDDGELKFFAFGVHSIDFERYSKWDDLRTFANRYGSRPDTYWYTTVGEVFDYEEAASMLEVKDGKILNHSSSDLYIKIDGENNVIESGSEILLED